MPWRGSPTYKKKILIFVSLGFTSTDILASLYVTNTLQYLQSALFYLKSQHQRKMKSCQICSQCWLLVTVCPTGHLQQPQVSFNYSNGQKESSTKYHSGYARQKNGIESPKREGAEDRNCACSVSILCSVRENYINQNSPVIIIYIYI